MSERLLIVGDVLLDRDVEGHSERLCPDAPVPVVDQLASRPRAGGAGLAATLAAADGNPVTLVTALAPDPAGAEIARLLLTAGVDLIDLGLDGETPEKIRVLEGGRPLLRLDRGGGGKVGSDLPAAVLQGALETASAVLVSDYGHGVAADRRVRRALVRRPSDQPLVWDPHPRGAAPLAGTSLVTPNGVEASGLFGEDDEAPNLGEAGKLARALRQRWSVEAVAVTCGEDGAVLSLGGSDVWGFSSDPVEGDPCGAGDRFAAEAALVLACGGDTELAVSTAVSVAAEFVAAGGAAAIAPPEPAAILDAGEQGVGASPLSIEPALRLAERVRRQGGAVVATGGCFDLLHVGHLKTLRTARALGDCLVVLLNGDRSVRRLKGPTRPIVGELERAAVLSALDCVDEVVIFDEDTPTDALNLLRPDVWAKGGDYAAKRLPEREAIASWGGRTAILPHLDGRSTSKLIERVEEHG
jgi:D-beta-D-heptose 7-phosphate kinase/D-beta-D-heptose 1-phosphate adenosyltransferase